MTRRAYASCLLVAALALALGACTRGGDEAALATRFDAALERLVAAKQFSGAVVASRHGRVVYQRGFGLANHATGLAFTPETSADGGSMAKTFTAAGVWWLVHEARIDLDAPVWRYVPEYPHRMTKVRHLLAHSNGLPASYEFFDPYFTKDQVRTTEGLLREVAERVPAPAFDPGSRFEYSSLGFDVAALAIERVTGQGYEAFLKERFFTRLGLTHTFARPARLADWPGVRTLGYRWQDASWQVFDVFDMEAFLGASNLYFSAADLGRWASANAAGTALPAAVTSVGQRRIAIAGRPSPINGLSWYCDDSGARCYYTGSNNAFHSLVYWDRERRDAVAFIANSTLPPWETITLQRTLVDALARRPAIGDAPGAFIEITTDNASIIAGGWTGDGIGVATVSHRDARPMLRIDDGLECEMFQVSRDVFYVPGSDSWVAFSGGQRPSTMHVRSMFLDATLQRREDRAGPQP